MENTIENAKKYLLNKGFSGFANHSCVPDWLVAYAALFQLEQRQATRTAIADALDREVETRPPIRIVIPSRLDIVNYFTDTNFPDFYRGGANWMYDRIRTLNAGAEFVETDKNETK